MAFPPKSSKFGQFPRIFTPHSSGQLSPVHEGYMLTTHPTTLSLQINFKEVHMSELVQYNGSQKHPTNVRYVWHQLCIVTAPLFFLPQRRTTHLES